MKFQSGFSVFRMGKCAAAETLCITSMISSHSGFPLEEDLGSSLLCSISYLHLVQHQKTATTLNTDCMFLRDKGTTGLQGVGINIVPW